jgi:hypothetical protein
MTSEIDPAIDPAYIRRDVFVGPNVSLGEKGVTT